ncbi:SEL1-like repeat protein [Streptomyces beihaiensis]|uniref:Sel1 repeat family protein n=1 Tax=Streptomyces beihaiensis TaxID=2984495 RepID=A0ABT3U5F8_9ACTN|nr:hypothetical protein [Streptomyces beihaiensis]MCX3063445.1 hypothetical protein [Streptomyces beihaiensis]
MADALVAAMRSGGWSEDDRNQLVRHFEEVGIANSEASEFLLVLRETSESDDAWDKLKHAVVYRWLCDRLGVTLERAPQARTWLSELADAYGEYEETGAPVIDYAPPAWYTQADGGTEGPGPDAEDAVPPVPPDLPLPDAEDAVPPVPPDLPPRFLAPDATTATTSNTVSGGIQQSVVQAAHIDTVNQHFGAAPGDGPDWRPVQDVGPAEFGVRPTRREPGLPDVPPYAARDCDAELADKLGQYGFVLLLGRPVTGMSYTAWHAARQLEGHQLYAPERGADLRALLGTLKGHPGRYLLWLDDIEDHLGERGLEPGLLGRLTALGVRVLATMDVDAYYERRTGSAPGDRVVALAHTVELPGTWSASEFDRLVGRAVEAEDPRAYEAYLWAEDGNPVAYLALGHLLYEEWQRLSARAADPQGVAVVRAALDVARCGQAGPVPARLLGDLAGRGGTEWAARQRIGGVGFLLPGRESDTWRVHGALVAGELRAGREPLGDDEHWKIYGAAKSCQVERPGIADALEARLRPRAELGDRDAAYGIGMLRLDTDDNDGERWLRVAADADHLKAAERLAVRLLDRGDRVQAVPYMELLVDGGQLWAATELAEYHRDRAEELLTAAVDKDAPNPGGAFVMLGDLVAGTPGRETEAMRHYLMAWRGGDHDAAIRIGGLLHDWGNAEAAEVWYRYAAGRGDPLAHHYLGVLLYNRGGHERQASYHLNCAAEAGHIPALTTLGMLEERQGRTRAAFDFYLRADVGGDPEGAYRLAALASHTQRDTVLRRAAALGHYQAGEETGAFSPPTPDTVEE